MSHDAAEQGIHMNGEMTDHCEVRDSHGRWCTQDDGHTGEHTFPVDPLEDIEDPVEAFIEENENF